MAGHFPVVDVEVGNELFYYIFDGEPRAEDGFVDLDENVAGLGMTGNQAGLKDFEIDE
jgi:L-lyxonate dehydratase